MDPSFELKGTVREIPAVSVYGTLSSDDSSSILKRLRPYVSLRTGLIQLNDVQALDPISAEKFDLYAGVAQTFQIGASLGVAFGYKQKVYPFVEYSWQRRKFPSVQWFAQESEEIPRRFPRELDFSGNSLTVGIRVALK